MTGARLSRASAAGRVLDEAHGSTAMTWVIGIMLFLTMLAAALGLGMRGAGRLLDRQLAGRLTVQLVTGDPAAADAMAARLVPLLGRDPAVAAAHAVPRAELERLLAPWLGSDAADPALPVPAMIDVDLADPGDAAVARVSRLVRAAAPAARVDRHEAWMSPVTGFVSTLTWLGLALVLLMATATALVVVLAARAGLETHRATIEVMHMLGSTDVQVARLFQRRVAIDAAVGGAAGGAAALLTVALLGSRSAALGSELIGSIALSGSDWLLLALLPLGFVLLATLAARVAVIAALRQAL